MVIPQSTRGSKRFFWDIVLNNYTNEDCEFVKATFDEICDAYIVGKEVGEKCGTPHLQMCVKLKKGNYKRYLIIRLGDRYSIREGRNINAMRNYCLKGEDILYSKNIDNIKIEERNEERDEERDREREMRYMNIEVINRRELYEQFLRESDRSIDNWQWLHDYLLSNIDKPNYLRHMDRE